MRHWLIKSEPDAYSIDDLAKDGQTTWDGVRNYQARNFMSNDMLVGDQILFYHSNADPTGIAGLAKVTALAAPDPSQFKKGDYHEPRATRAKPVWFCVTVGFVAKFPRVLTLDELRTKPALADMALLRKGQRLSIQPVTAGEFGCVRRLTRR